MKVALVHDWLTGMRGGERILQELALLFPDADLYTLIFVPGSTSPEIESLRIHQSPLSRIPGAARHYRKGLPLFPWAIESLEVAPCDLVVSSSHAVAKGILAPRGVPHLCYCMTPMRYVWDQIDAYLGRGALRAAATPLVAYLRSWDQRTSSPERVTEFIAISETTRERIATHYGRDARVIYPPVEVDAIRRAEGPPEDFFLLVGGFVPYKREDLAIDAFRELDRTLLVAGDGPTRAALERRAPRNVHFLGRISDERLHDLYRRCRALIYPQLEDFGIIAVEAQAAGRPVIAYGQGGAAETVIPIEKATHALPTGTFFDVPDPRCLAEAVRAFEHREREFDAKSIAAHARRFSRPRFVHEMRDAIARLMDGAPAGR